MEQATKLHEELHRRNPALSQPNEAANRAAWKQGVMGAVSVLHVVLAVRLILLLAVCGAFALALLGLQTNDWRGLGILMGYTGSVVIPLVVLALRQ